MIALRFSFTLLLLFLATLQGFSQSILNGNGVKGEPQKKEFTPLYKSILIIPFEDKLYLSDADRDIAQGSAVKDHHTIKDRFRDGLMISLSAGSKLRYKALAFTLRDTLILPDLYEAFSAIKYKYEDIPKKDDKKESSIFKTVSNTNEKKAPKGQIGSSNDISGKFMMPVVKNTETMHYLAEKYETDLFLFISQFEIKNDMSDASGFAYGGFSRNCNVHYAFYDQNSKLVDGGIASFSFSSDVKDINQIISGNFSELAGQIFETIFGREKENEETQTGKDKITPKGYKE